MELSILAHTEIIMYQRGYAVILGESIGTGKSDGCPTTGDEQENIRDEICN